MGFLYPVLLRLFFLISAIIIVSLSVTVLSDRQPPGLGQDLSLMAYHLNQNGVASLELSANESDPEPSMAYEPLYPLIQSVFLLFSDGNEMQAFSTECFLNAEQCPELNSLLKNAGIFFHILMTIAAGWAMLILIQSTTPILSPGAKMQRTAARQRMGPQVSETAIRMALPPGTKLLCVAVMLLIAFYPGFYIGTEALNPVSLTALLLLMHAATLSQMVCASERRLHFAILSGMTFGLLCLVEDTFLYLIPVYAVMSIFTLVKLNFSGFVRWVVMLGASAAIIAPWIMRNLALLNVAGISKDVFDLSEAFTFGFSGNSFLSVLFISPQIGDIVLFPFLSFLFVVATATLMPLMIIMTVWGIWTRRLTLPIMVIPVWFLLFVAMIAPETLNEGALIAVTPFVFLMLCLAPIWWINARENYYRRLLDIPHSELGVKKGFDKQNLVG